VIAEIMWDWVYTGVVVWAIIAAIPLALLAVIGLIYAACLGGAYFVDWLQSARSRWQDHSYRQAKAKADKPMGAAKLDHIKYDILPDGSLGPGDPRGLEDPE
jgi:hypothetical protein